MMMLLLAALTVPAEPSAPVDIVVIGKRFDEAHGVIKRNLLTGGTKCTITASSGDGAIDKGYCDIATSCVKAAKKRPAFDACMAEGKRRFLDQYFSAKQASDGQD